MKNSEGYILMNKILFMKSLFIDIFHIQGNGFINISFLCPRHLPSPLVSSCWDNPNVLSPIGFWRISQGGWKPGPRLCLIYITIPRMAHGWSPHQLFEKLCPFPTLTKPLLGWTHPNLRWTKATPIPLKNTSLSMSHVYTHGSHPHTQEHRNRYIPRHAGTIYTLTLTCAYSASVHPINMS